jgi:type II secretory pathway pseudopilin PulG
MKTQNNILPAPSPSRYGHARHAKTTRGFVSAEMGLVIILGAIMLTAAIYVFLNNRKQAAINENTNQIIGIAEQAKKLYGSRGEYANVTGAIAAATLVPQQLRDRGAAGILLNTMHNPYGGAITFTPVAVAVNGATDLLALSWTSVPRSHCVDLILGTAAPMRRVTVGTGGGAVVVKALDAAAIPIAALSAACDANDPVTITFDIGAG